MIGRRIAFYCAKSDLLAILREAEDEIALKYVRAGSHMSASAAGVTLATGADIPGIGESVHGDMQLDAAWLLLPGDAVPQAREVSLNEGGKVWMVDFLDNPDAVSLRPGGLYGGRVLVPGEFGSISKRAFPERLIRALRAILKRRARLVREHWIGREAERQWKEGLRLTRYPNASAKHDFAAEV